MLLTAIRTSLLLLPFPIVRAQVDRWSRRQAAIRDAHFKPADFAWAIRQAGALIPKGKHCLSQAMTLSLFLSRRQLPATIRYGVRRGPDLALMAHAWVEHDGLVLIGGENLSSFVELSGIEEKQRF